MSRFNYIMRGWIIVVMLSVIAVDSFLRNGFNYGAVLCATSTLCWLFIVISDHQSCRRSEFKPSERLKARYPNRF